MEYEIRNIENDDYERINNIIKEWSSEIIVTKGNVYSVNNLEGIIPKSEQAS
jgi:hypothetical protein